MSRKYTLTEKHIRSVEKSREATRERNEQIYKDYLSRGNTSILDLEIKYGMSRQRINQIIKRKRMSEVVPSVGLSDIT